MRLVARHAPALAKLDLSHCGQLGDPALALLTAPGCPLRDGLAELNLAGETPPPPKASTGVVPLASDLQPPPSPPWYPSPPTCSPPDPLSPPPPQVAPA